jgi:hypothetical protein
MYYYCLAEDYGVVVLKGFLLSIFADFHMFLQLLFVG